MDTSSNSNIKINPDKDCTITKKLVPCNICGSQNFKILYKDELGEDSPPVDYNFNEKTRKTFQIVKCDACSFIFTNPMPILNTVYVENVDQTYLQSSHQRRITALNSVKKLRAWKKSGNLLDIGCATGIFLDEAKLYFNVEGIELSQWAAKLAAKNHIVHQQPLTELNFKSKFDIITLWGVIEHFDSPRKEIEAVYESLKPGGLAVIYTGNVDAWIPKVLKKRWWWYQGMHLAYFSLKTLTKLLEQTGFKILHHHNHVVYFQLFSLAKSINRYKIGRLISPFLSLPGIRNVTIPIKLNGEMVLYAIKS